MVAILQIFLCMQSTSCVCSFLSHWSLQLRHELYTFLQQLCALCKVNQPGLSLSLVFSLYIFHTREQRQSLCGGLERRRAGDNVNSVLCMYRLIYPTAPHTNASRKCSPCYYFFPTVLCLILARSMALKL